MLKSKWAQNGVIYSKTRPPNHELIPKLITVSTISRSGILNQSTWSTNELICLTDLCCPLKEGDLATSNPLFVSNFLVLSPSAYKGLFILYSSSQLLSVCSMRCCSLYESSNKAKKSFKIYSVEFCFFNLS